MDFFFLYHGHVQAHRAKSYLPSGGRIPDTTDQSGDDGQGGRRRLSGTWQQQRRRRGSQLRRAITGTVGGVVGGAVGDFLNLNPTSGTSTPEQYGSVDHGRNDNQNSSGSSGGSSGRRYAERRDGESKEGDVETEAEAKVEAAARTNNSAAATTATASASAVDRCDSDAHNDGEEGEMLDLGVMGPGSYFGEISILTDTNCRATIVTKVGQARMSDTCDGPAMLVGSVYSEYRCASPHPTPLGDPRGPVRRLGASSSACPAWRSSTRGVWYPAFEQSS